MTSIRNVVTGTLLTGGALLAAAAGFGLAGLPAAMAADATAPAATTAGPHAGGPGHLYSQLGLSAEQQASIKSIFTAAKPQMQSLHEQMKANHLKLSQTSPDDPNYPSIVSETASSNATLAAQRTTQSENIRAQINAILTPAQKTQLAALKAQWAANPHHHRWGGHDRGAAPATE
jgi:protein CpxP